MDPLWYEARSVDDAISRRVEYGDGAVFVAGGTFVMLLMRTGLLFPEVLVSLGGIPGLDTIRVEDGELHLGALVRHRAVEHSAIVRDRWPSLASTFGVVASPRVRNQATVGGVLADADYASDPPATLVALNARARLRGRGVREVPVSDLIVGHYETQIAEDELLVEVVVPPMVGRGIYRKVRTRSSEDRPCVGVAAVLDVDEARTVRDVRVVVGAVSDKPQYFPEICAAARGRPLTPQAIAELADGYADTIDPISDLRGSAAYRKRVTRAMIVRTLGELVHA